MTAAAPVVDTPRTQADVKPCVLMLLAPLGFDMPCACEHTSDRCTKRSDGSCDG